MSRFFRNLFRSNGLSIVLLAIFAVSFVGQSVAGYLQHNDDQRTHGQPTISYRDYLRSGEFVETVFENWESEFLQMALYVWLTSFLYQRGSAESKDPDRKEDVDEDPANHRHDPGAPLPVRAGGLLLKLYEQSLALALLLLFLISFGLHWVGSWRQYCNQQIEHGQTCITTVEHLGSATFWFESLQNWQSEFLSIGVVVILSIFLRQKGSPESKPVHSPHSATGR